MNLYLIYTLLYSGYYDKLLLPSNEIRTDEDSVEFIARRNRACEDSI